MRWRFVDRVTHFEPWREIAGLKVVSLEEYYLPEPLGRLGVLPETLILECLVQLATLLAEASSDFEQRAQASLVKDFRVHQAVTMGAVLNLHAVVQDRGADDLLMACRAATGAEAVAMGVLGCSLVPAGPEAAAANRARWRELYG